MATGGVAVDTQGGEVSDSDDVYEDAEDQLTNVHSSPPFISGNMTLTEAIRDVTKAMDLFLNNHFEEAKAMFERHSKTSLYHALGYATCMYLQASMTFTPTHIEAAIETVRQAVQTCTEHRTKKSGPFLSKKGKSYYNSLTAVEIHAELCYADCLMQRAILSFLEDENMMSFIRGALKIKSCYNSYKDCKRLLNKRDWKYKEMMKTGDVALALSACGCDPEELQQFRAGVAMGNGMFKLMISLLPSKVMKLLEFVGFSGDRASGLRDLEEGANLVDTLRGPLCCMALVAFHCFVTYMLGSGEGDVELATRTMEKYSKRYPQAALFLFLHGRVEICRGRLEQGISKYEESIAAQNEWKQFHHLCFWELMWCYAYMDDFVLAMKYAEMLYNDSKWSVATYAYVKATFLMMVETGKKEEREHIKELLNVVPKSVQRRAGKSIPVEKFAVKKVNRYYAQGERLVLPAYELMYVWSAFLILGKHRAMVNVVLKNIEKSLQEIEAKGKGKVPHYKDDYCLALFLKGVLLRFNGEANEAIQCFNEVLSQDKEMTEDRYILPASLYEISLIHLEAGRLTEAKQALQAAKHDHKGYSLESRIMFRVHSVESRIKMAEAELDGSSRRASKSSSSNSS